MRTTTNAENRIASRWYPKGSIALNQPDGLGVAFVSLLDAVKGSWQVVAYRGTAGKPEMNFSYRNREQAERKVSEWFDSLLAHKAQVVCYRAKVNEPTTLKSGEPNYLSTTETAKLIRAAIKKAFPRVKFSVRSDSYSGGSSIRVDWTDGPTTKQVNAIASQYEGAGFDGSIDLKYGFTSWLMPDGSAIVADCSGTVGSRGSVAPIHNDKPHADAVLVRFSSDFVFCSRHYSDAVLANAGGQKEAWQTLQDVAL
jgi:hypothetical protein